MQKPSTGRKILAFLEGAWLGIVLGLLTILDAMLGFYGEDKKDR